MGLKEVYYLPDPYLASPSMVFNGGIAGSGNEFSSISGAAMAMGILAEKHIIDHVVAKKVAMCCPDNGHQSLKWRKERDLCIPIC